jgi:hypothetical protein
MFMLYVTLVKFNKRPVLRINTCLSIDLILSQFSKCPVLGKKRDDHVRCMYIPLCMVFDSASAISVLDFLCPSSGDELISIWSSCLIFGFTSSSNELEAIGELDALLFGVVVSLSSKKEKNN